VDKFTGSHHGVGAAAEEVRLVKTWIDTLALFPGTYAATGQMEMWTSSKPSVGILPCDLDVLKRRCSSCHAPDSDYPGENPLDGWPFGTTSGRSAGGSDRFINLDRPIASPLLLAPLAPEAGGWGLCQKNADGRLAGDSPKTGVFASTSDADYQTLLDSISEAGRHLQTVTRFDLPTFVPPRSHLEWMVRHDIIDADFDATQVRIDCYALDQLYYRSFGRYGTLAIRGLPTASTGRFTR
jgi:hypothetical protein